MARGVGLSEMSRNTLTFTFVGGESQERPDVDLCLTTGIIIE